MIDDFRWTMVDCSKTNRAPTGRTTLAQAIGLGSEPIPSLKQALKGRDIVLGSTRMVIEAGLVIFITPLQGWRTRDRATFLTQAVGLGCARPPLRG